MYKDRRMDIDAFRGVAIVLMIIFHLTFDLEFLRIVHFNFEDLWLVLFQRVVGTMFLLLVGISLILSEKKNNEGYKRHLKRAVKLGAVALLISIATWIVAPEEFIKFGVIHCIAVSTLMAPLFFRFKWLNLILGIILIITGISIHYTEIDYLFWLGWITHTYTALDHYPLIPWFGIVLIGLFLGKVMPEFKVKNKLTESLTYLGRNSLLIYVIHQPLIISLLLLLFYLR
ncbi:MAG: heparan-alpha-glucosaminide N-acetyltransferase [Candidatus Micrarchaeota archaeon]